VTLGSEFLSERAAIFNWELVRESGGVLDASASRHDSSSRLYKVVEFVLGHSQVTIFMPVNSKLNL
jgi:hypothetical protein